MYLHVYVTFKFILHTHHMITRYERSSHCVQYVCSSQCWLANDQQHCSAVPCMNATLLSDIMYVYMYRAQVSYNKDVLTKHYMYYNCCPANYLQTTRVLHKTLCTCIWAPDTQHDHISKYWWLSPSTTEWHWSTCTLHVLFAFNSKTNYLQFFEYLHCVSTLSHRSYYQLYC